MASFFQPDSTRPHPARPPYLRVVPNQPSPNRWITPSLICGAIFPVTLLIFLALFAFVPGFRFPFFQGAIGLITIAPTTVALFIGVVAYLHERRLAPVIERRTLHRLALAALGLATFDLLATVALVLWGIVTSTVATGGSPF